LLRNESGQWRADGSVSGQRILDAEPDVIGRLADRLPHGSVLVSGTNGKTTTTSMVSAVLGAVGITTLGSQVGANQASGVAAELMAASRVGGRMAGDCGVFEVDELWLEQVLPQITPVALVLGNLFRDQLDRSGELESVSGRWSKMLDTCRSRTQLVLCADDPRVAALGRGRPAVLYFGLEDDGIALARLAHAADPMHCPICTHAHDYDVIYLSHLGRYFCRACGERRPEPEVFATDIRLHGINGSSFSLRTPGGQSSVSLKAPGLYNIYNAVAAAAVGHTLGVPPDIIASALSAVTPVFGRAEVIDVGDSQLVLLLVKNPTGMHEVMRMLLTESNGDRMNVLLVLNDSVYDGRDVSWIWDADLEVLAEPISRATCGGTRAAEMALRLKYAGVPTSAIAIESSVAAAIDTALATGPERVHVLANYTAMLDVRDLLAERGHVDSIWR
jgi:UDP-N-acetylmuramyl tripeptide synthase